MAPNLSTVRPGPVPSQHACVPPASAFCPACGRNLADCQCSGEATPVCNSCQTPAGQHHHGCFRCPAMAAVLNAAERAKFRVTDNAALADQVQHDRSAL